MILDTRLAVVYVHELIVAEELIENLHGWVPGDRNYWNPRLAELSRSHGLIWLTQNKSTKRQQRPRPIWIKHKRCRSEDVTVQLVACFNAKQA